MTNVSILCPIEPHELDKHHRLGMEDIVRRVAAQSAVKGNGNDLLLRVYLAGIHHGVRLGEERTARGKRKESGGG